MANSKPIKKSDALASYVIGVVGILASIVCWFLPTMEADYYLSDVGSLLLGSQPKTIYYTFFSFSDSLPLVTNVINLFFLACSAVSLVLVLLPLIKKRVLSPNKTLLFPAITYFLYLVVFYIRFFNAQHYDSLYDARITPVTVIYFLSLVAVVSFTATMFFYAPRLKRQQEADSANA